MNTLSWMIPDRLSTVGPTLVGSEVSRKRKADTSPAALTLPRKVRLPPSNWISWMITCPPVIVMRTDVSVAHESLVRPTVLAAVPTYLPSKAGAAGPCADEVAAGTATALRTTKALRKPRTLICRPPRLARHGGVRHHPHRAQF